jgi:hypothetical protein
VQPSLIAGDHHSEFTLDGRNLVFKAIIITIKKSDTALAGCHLEGWVCINLISFFCIVGMFLGLFSPVITSLTRVGDLIADKSTD